MLAPDVLWFAHEIEIDAARAPRMPDLAVEVRSPATWVRSEVDRLAKGHLGSERFDPTLWCVVRAGDEIAAGTICAGDTLGGGWVHVLFTRRPWRRQGVGAALLGDSFGRFWERGEHSVGLSVTRRATPARSASTSAPGWRPCSAG